MLRLYRLIIEEYNGLKEKILVESPFAEVTRDGEGVRQVQLALTKKYILIGEDNFEKDATENLSNVYYDPDIEPVCETLRITEVLPLKSICVKIYKRDTRHLLKVIAGNYLKVLYFEFGGHTLRRMYWIIWKDKLEQLKISYNRFTKTPKRYVDPFTEPETALTSNSEYELPCSYKIYADVHTPTNLIRDKFKIDNEKDLTYIEGTDEQPLPSSTREKMESIQRYFYDKLTNTKLLILNTSTPNYDLIKTNSDNEYILDLKQTDNFCGTIDIARKSVSVPVISKANC